MPAVLPSVHLRADSPESVEHTGATQGPGARADLTTTPQLQNTTTPQDATEPVLFTASYYLGANVFHETTQTKD